MTGAAQVRTTFVFGATGRIGSAIMRRLEGLGMPAVALPRPVFEACQSGDLARKALLTQNLRENDRVIIATGEVDPAADTATLFRVNTDIPAHIAKAALGLGARPVTLGTVMERRMPARAHNRYIASKAALAKLSEGRWLHLQLHTIYGGPAPHRKMFAGHMLESLIAERRFSMTSGAQQREYHHVDDEAVAILNASTLDRFTPTELSSGAPLSLAELATDVFRFFGRDDLLGINDLESPTDEVYVRPDIQSPEGFATFRDARPAVALWLSAFVRAPDNDKDKR